jgi:anti-sigma B factor antagonist
MASPLECEIGSAGPGEPVTVTVRGEVDIATAPEFESALQGTLDDGPSSVVVDLDALTFIDSSGLRVLLAFANEARTRDAVLVLRNVPNHAQRVLDATGLSHWFERTAER